jgi:D-methionine transport system ATP-binding protein
MIEVKNISKTYYQKKTALKALNDVSLYVDQGDILGIIGFSGAGKSTLIRCINLLEKPDQGQVIVNGIDLTKLNTRQLAEERKKIGMIFQHFNLLSSRTVFGNVALPLELDKLSNTEIHQKVNKLLALVGLEDKVNEYPKNLSGGQKQRVAIARALANDPHLLLCDEATSALDPATTLSILKLLRDINQRLNITVLLITHEMEVVKAICNHVAVIDNGSLVANGPLEQVIADKEHPVIKQFIISHTASIPRELDGKLHEKNCGSLLPVIELQLDGNLSFEEIISLISNQNSISYQLLKADIDYLGTSNIGSLLLQLKGTSKENEMIIEKLNSNKIQNTIKGYA